MIVFIVSIILIVCSWRMYAHLKFFKKTKTDNQPQTPTVHLYYGSQTGTAHKFCQTIKEQALFPSEIHSLEDYQSMTNNVFNLIIIATHYEGDPTDNSKSFYEFLQEKNTFKVRFGVFGCGNSTYKNFNKMGREVQRILTEKGGKSWYPYGEGDDFSSLEYDFDKWRVNLQEIYLDFVNQGILLPLNKDNFEEYKQIQIPQPKQQQNNIIMNCYQDTLKNVEYEFQTKNFFESKLVSVLSIKELKKDPDLGQCLEVFEEIQVILDLKEYQSAGNLIVYPRNSKEAVLEICQYLQVNPEDQVLWNQNKLPFPLPITHYEALAQYSDFQGIIKKKMLKDLSVIAKDLDVQNELKLLSSLKGQAQYKLQFEEKIQKLLPLLKRYSIQLNFEQFIQITSRISPRYFTLASCPPNPAKILVSITPGGLCSNYFLSNPKQIYCLEKKSSFILDKNKPKIYIANGAGIAPFLAFLEQDTNETYLYFGCRKEADYIYKQFLESRNLDLLKICKSREGQGYVQEGIRQDLIKIIKKIEQGAIVYICGSLAMGKAVMAILGESFPGGCEYLEKNKQIIKELWG